MSYVITRQIELGFEGWIAVFPPLSGVARVLLEEKGPEKFRESHGDYFISG